MASYRENFKISDVGKGIKDVGKDAGKGVKDVGKDAGKGIKDVGKDVGKGILGLPNQAMRKVFGPAWDWLLGIWGWFKYVCSVMCCLCVASCCLSLGIPQMAISAVGSARGGTTPYYTTR